MCGIVGVLSFYNSNFRITEDYIIKMRDAMIHRGPDGSGIWISKKGNVGLGHRRLAIIDLSHNAAQPMCNEDGSLWIVYNGEIYNHMAIRSELEATGRHKWKTDHSDTEVILHSFEEWGIECIFKFRGMFAFAIWDNNKNELWLVRDRIGIKPLYYSIHNGRLTFSSEIKALLEDPHQKREVNEEAFYHYLTFVTTPSPNTIYDGIKKLPHATWIKITEDGQLRETRYWDVLDHTQSLNGLSEKDISDKIIIELEESVRLRKISDVPIGVFLSGGIDSSTNAALFSMDEKSKIKTFTIGYEGDYKSYPNETYYAKLMAQKVGAHYHQLLLKIDDLLSFLPNMIQLQDEPIADPVCVPIYYVSKLARDNNVTVCQLGEGADELFCGYPFWKHVIRLQKLNNIQVPTILKKWLLSLIDFSNKSNTTHYELLWRGVNNYPLFWGGTSEGFPELIKKRIISPRLREKFLNYSSWEVINPIFKRFQEKAFEKSTLNWMSYLDLNLRLPELILMRVDKMTMAVSLEARVPFLDHKFVELAMSIPSDLKIKNGVLKYILKKSVRGIIPDELIDRKKQGFIVPVHEWFMEELGEFTKKELKDFCNKTDFLDQQEVMKLFHKGKTLQVWFLLNFAMWWKEYIYK